VLNGKKILLGVTGSIAAYKAALITRLLIKSGAEVQVVMTEAASDFITPLTLSTLSKNPALSKFIANDEGEWNNHVNLALWADLILIAPSSANTIAKMANGICDNLLLAVYLSARSPVMIAPAMDLDMYQHSSTKENIAKLKTRGNLFIDPEHGDLASGLVGTGRMAEVENIITAVENYFNSNFPLLGKKALVTAGPTQEKIDPVRFIGNNSSGKMGVAIARQLKNTGAEVTLILGPTKNSFDLDGIMVKNVTSADEMYKEAIHEFDKMDMAVLVAAVADYKPTIVSDSKIKKGKSTKNLTIELTQTPDIAAALGALKTKSQLTIGFALETNDEEVNARKKLKLKNFDMIVLNSLQDEGAGFGHDTNKIMIIDKENKSKKFELKTKEKAAKDIVDAIIEKLP